jgi:REP-associated tyrosine transposase
VTDFFDSEADFRVYRRNLPHWRQAGATYLVTFRLADSLPTQKLATLKEQKKRWLALNPPPHKENQITEYHRNFSQRVHE